MKINLLLVVMLILVFPMLLVAQGATGEMNMEQLIIYLTPFIVWGVGQLVKWMKPHIKGMWLLLILGSSSAVLVFVTDLAANTDVNWLLQFGYNLLCVFAHQFYKQIKSKN